MGKLLDYHNDLNSVPLKRFNEKEIDLFFDILFYLKDSEKLQMKYEFIELQHLTNIRDKARFIDYLDNLVGHLGKLLYRKRTIKKLTVMPLFSKFEVDFDNEKMDIKLNPEFHYILLEATKNYTKIDFIEFKNLKSSYSKMLFKCLKQFSKTGIFQIKLADFNELFEVPVSYNMSETTRAILNPCIKELKPLFPGLKLTKIRKGRKIETLKFNFRKTIYIPKIKNKNGTKSKTFEPKIEEVLTPEEQKDGTKEILKARENLKKIGVSFGKIKK